MRFLFIKLAVLAALLSCNTFANCPALKWDDVAKLKCHPMSKKQNPEKGDFFKKNIGACFYAFPNVDDNTEIERELKDIEPTLFLHAEINIKQSFPLKGTFDAKINQCAYEIVTDKKKEHKLELFIVKNLK